MERNECYDGNMYKVVCKPQLDRIEHNVDKVMKIITGNGTSGLVAEGIKRDLRISVLESWHSTVTKLLIIVTSALVISVITYVARTIWIFDQLKGVK